jgi:hypothetical protein
MDVVDVYYVGGFGVMGWVPESDYEHARPDPLVDVACGIIEHMNADHKDALVQLARMFAGVESHEAAMTSVDRLGFHVRLKTQYGMRGARIAFLREVSSPGETRKVLVEMVQQVRQRFKMPSVFSEIKLSVNPDRAAVFVDGLFVGHVAEFGGVAHSLLVAPGHRQITISLPGYETFQTVVDLAPHQKFKLKTDLLKSPATPPPPPS